MQISSLISNYSINSDNIVNVTVFDSPVGKVIAAGDVEFIYFVCFEDSKNVDKIFKTVSEELSCSFKEDKNKLLETLEDEFRQYFEGTLKKFTVPIKTFGSDFQKEVWNKLSELPYGSTQTYGDIAQALGRSGGHARAIGAACGANSHFIIIPCHRIVASASKGGFSGGLDRKEWLLEHEKLYAE
ncbi:methylated-DNA--protein-cysteine methyltransferase [Zerene cesonia]|uniref:methylated-DNA--protein-cysteine methyltransferase n=1 Tax=Zerene cesonia TaxID=33412 RepID=UPI0018E55966|nr:methylated-DNA--protein-cysteine methyltransferase [Zerene cesonia]